MSFSSFFYIISTSNLNHIKSQESKIPKIICEVINEVMKNSEISTVAILTGKRDFSINFQSELHHCLSRKILQFVINLTKIPNEVYLPDSTIYVLEAGLPKAWKLLHNDFMNYYVCSVRLLLKSLRRSSRYFRFNTNPANLCNSTHWTYFSIFNSSV